MFAADRATLDIQSDPHDHLSQVGPVVLAVAVLPDAFAPVSLEAEGGRVEEHKAHFAEEVAPPVEEGFFDEVLGAAREAHEPFPNGLAQPTHGPVELVEADLRSVRNAVVFLPHLRRAIAATGEKPVEHGQVDRPFQIEAVFASSSQIPDDLPQTRALPEATEDKVGPDFADGHRLGFPGGMGIENFHLAGKTQPTAQQAVELATFLQDIEPAQRGDDLLAHGLAPAHTACDLQISVAFGGFDSEKYQCGW